ncbi:hypothetical protein IAT38_003103 [Cryptococcus sp. DSM 104549]
MSTPTASTATLVSSHQDTPSALPDDRVDFKYFPGPTLSNFTLYSNGDYSRTTIEHSSSYLRDAKLSSGVRQASIEPGFGATNLAQAIPPVSVRLNPEGSRDFFAGDREAFGPPDGQSNVSFLGVSNQVIADIERREAEGRLRCAERVSSDSKYKMVEGMVSGLHRAGEYVVGNPKTTAGYRRYFPVKARWTLGFDEATAGDAGASFVLSGEGIQISKSVKIAWLDQAIGKLSMRGGSRGG